MLDHALVRPSSRTGCASLALLLAALILPSGGCATTGGAAADAADADDAPRAPVFPPTPPAVAWSGEPRDLPVLDGRTGEPMTWDELLARVGEADAVIVGEQHDDAAGHAWQAALVGDAIAARGGGTLALEMLERDQQPVIDDWMDGIIDGEALAVLTDSSSWAGEDSWELWYQPILDAARSAGGRVIAANAPRRYVSLARTGGFDPLEALPAPRRGFVALPAEEVDDSRYFDRFVDVMSGHMTQEGAGPDEAALARMRATFRAQRTWDSTMADSVARALGRGTPLVLLMIGQFHSDFDGATVLELRHRAPDARVLTISLQRRDGAALAEEDRGRADVVVHTGARVPPVAAR